jgi:Phage integrase, N-terminal SAM-like domain
LRPYIFFCIVSYQIAERHPILKSRAISMPAPPSAASPGPQPPRLLGQVRQTALGRFGRPERGERHADWVRRYILFHGKRHPRDLGAGDAGRFLEHIPQSEKDPLRCLEQAQEALTFLYQDVLHLNLGELALPQPPRLLDRVRHAIRARHYSLRTESCYVEWVERFIRFHGRRHPNTMINKKGLATYCKNVESSDRLGLGQAIAKSFRLVPRPAADEDAQFAAALQRAPQGVRARLRFPFWPTGKDSWRVRGAGPWRYSSRTVSKTGAGDGCGESSGRSR